MREDDDGQIAAGRGGGHADLEILPAARAGRTTGFADTTVVGAPSICCAFVVFASGVDVGMGMGVPSVRILRAGGSGARGGPWRRGAGRGGSEEGWSHPAASTPGIDDRVLLFGPVERARAGDGLVVRPPVCHHD
ncbi:hypothetical protein SSPO_043040 [Streptomyces antimycoticus]|uniref:Uncharacterized protein n=1 Tax=Streptomyces antimycoticus TaxID=68175 RepID=A0A499UZ80_9ACTN|nr:hypothetical protein SSPO_043040 [Streptomyces antimycoticus]